MPRVGLTRLGRTVDVLPASNSALAFTSNVPAGDDPPMNSRLSFTSPLVLLALAGTCAANVGAQTSRPSSNTQPPTTIAAAREWSAAIARRAAELLSSPATWDRKDTTGACPDTAKTFGILCALQRASDEAMHASRDRAQSAASGRVECAFRREQTHEEGSCGAIVDELPVFLVEKVPAITTGMWRPAARPTEVWAGTMVDASAPVMQAARQTVNAISTKKYSARLIEFNNDSSTSFSDLQKFFRLLEDRLAQAQRPALVSSGDSVEIEVYPGATGVIRTFAGWFPISDFVARDSTVHFTIDTTHQIAASVLDRKIIERADAILSSDAVWNRADNRRCPATATTWSIYCALERATIEVTGGLHHRRPALELVRQIVDDRTKGRDYDHRLMDYNNDRSTHLSDVRSLFAEALARVKDE
jgi:hypothetical protein